jgi:4-amino-4-deoxy-L-arabinose transferase-like glycosyltransferase
VALVLMGASAGFALQSRATQGLYAVLAFAMLCGWVLLDPLVKTSRRPVVAALLVCGALVAFQGLVNFKRFGSPLEFRPMALHEAFHNTERGRLQVLHRPYRIDRVPFTFRQYVVPEPARFTRHWPFLRLTWPTLAQNDYDFTEPLMPMGVFCPALLLFAAFGAWRVRWRSDRAAVIMVAAAAPIVLMLLTLDTVTSRYEMDVVPPLAGLGLLSTFPPVARWGRRPAVTALGLLVVWSVLATTMTTVLLKVYGTGSEQEQIVRLLGWVGEQ